MRHKGRRTRVECRKLCQVGQRLIEGRARGEDRRRYSVLGIAHVKPLALTALAAPSFGPPRLPWPSLYSWPPPARPQPFFRPRSRTRAAFSVTWSPNARYIPTITASVGLMFSNAAVKAA